MLIEDAYEDEIIPNPRFEGEAGARKMLEKNGFAVVPDFHRQIFTPYVGSEIPVFITTDSIFYVFHRNLEESLKEVEIISARKLKTFLDGMIKATAHQYENSGPGEKEALSDNLAYFIIASKLMGQKVSLGPRIFQGSLKDKVEEEMKKIRDGKSISSSSIFDEHGYYRVDYTAFKPRGFYEGNELLSRYFTTMTWLGNSPFRVISKEETLSALLIATAFREDGELLSLYRELEGTMAFFWGESDDLTVEEYLGKSSKFFGEDIDLDDTEFDKKFQAFREALSIMRDPRINSMPLSKEETAHFQELTKGLRLFGKRYLPDSSVLASSPHIKQGEMPRGLDVMAALGSRRANVIIRKSSHITSSIDYESSLEESGKILEDEIEENKNRNIYSQFLYLLKNYLEGDKDRGLPLCMKTDAWKDRKLNTALSCWASMRHTWGLQAKNMVEYMGSCRVFPGYVEPEIEFYDNLKNLSSMCREKLTSLGVNTARYNQIDRILKILINITKKELNGEDLSKDDGYFMREYGEQIAHLCFL